MVAALPQVHDEIHVQRAARAEEDRRPPGREPRAVGSDEDVGRELVAVPLAHLAQAGRADLLAGLDQHLEVEAEPAARRDRRVDRGEVDRVLALVVRGAPAVEPLAFAP